MPPVSAINTAPEVSAASANGPFKPATAMEEPDVGPSREKAVPLPARVSRDPLGHSRRSAFAPKSATHTTPEPSGSSARPRGFTRRFTPRGPSTRPGAASAPAATAPTAAELYALTTHAAPSDTKKVPAAGPAAAGGAAGGKRAKPNVLPKNGPLALSSHDVTAPLGAAIRMRDCPPEPSENHALPNASATIASGPVTRAAAPVPST